MHRIRTTLALSASLVAVAAGIVAALPAHAADGPAWSVGPADTEHGTDRPNFDYALDPGDRVDDAFEIRNDGAVPLTLGVYAADAFTTTTGNIDLLPAAQPSIDSGTWIRLAVDQVTLNPGDEVIVPFILTVPANARPGDHPAGVVASLLSDDANANIQVDRRLGSRVQIRVSGLLEPAVEVGAPTVSYSGSWNPLAVGTLTVDYRLSNSGNTRVTAQSTVAGTGPLGIAAFSSGTQQQPEILPGSTIDVHHEITGIGALFWLSGSLVVAPESVGLGAERLDVVTFPLESIAVPLATLLIVLILAGATIVILVLRRRRAPGPSPDAG